MSPLVDFSEGTASAADVPHFADSDGDLLQFHQINGVGSLVCHNSVLLEGIIVLTNKKTHLSQNTLRRVHHTRGTTQIAPYGRHSSESYNSYALTRHSRESLLRLLGRQVQVLRLGRDGSYRGIPSARTNRRFSVRTQP